LLEYKEGNKKLGMNGDVAQRVERLLRMQEAGGSNPPISTRHTFASHLTRAGMDLATVSKLPGY